MLKDLDNEKKPWDDHHQQLFHRVQSDQFDKEREPASGKGYRCGARAPSDFKTDALADILANGLVDTIVSVLTGPIGKLLPKIITGILGAFSKQAKQIEGDLEKKLAKLISDTVEGALFGKYIKSIPAWVPVDRKDYGPQFDNKEGKEVEREVEGLLRDSFQLMRAIPYIQWNRWYPWAFDVAPIDGYAYVLGLGNRATPDEEEAIDEAEAHKLSLATDINHPDRVGSGGIHSIACLIDLGAFGVLPGDRGGQPRLPGAFFHPKWPFWPTAGDYFWACGRWVYDCVHTTSLEKKGENEGLMPTQLHPVKAFAAARYEGFKFQENEHATPATRFLFFACKKGGYLDFGTAGQGEKDTECAVRFNDKDYTFVMDLPEAFDPVDLKWPIGHTPEFPANNVVLRPTLLMDLEMAPFGLPTGSEFFGGDIQFDQNLKPKLELLEIADPNKPRQRQVRITVELSKVNSSATAYGFCASFGWFDPTGTQADLVKKVTFDWKAINFHHGFDNVRMNIGVNGRFLFAPLEGKKELDIDISSSDPRLTQFVPDDGVLRVEVHGLDRNGYGEAMEKNPAKLPELPGQNIATKDRTLRVGGIFQFMTPDQLKQLAASAKAPLTSAIGKVSPGWVKDLSGEMLDLLTGSRKEVKWKEHIDQKDSDVASAVAREMFTKILPLFNNENDPITLGDSAGSQDASALIGCPTGREVVMRDVVQFMKPDEKSKDFDLRLETTPLQYIADADGLAQNTVEGGVRVVLHINAHMKIERQ
ncbi:MAG TPA: hypothetical protein VG146_09105 [Verrucomicrobiae bacterium]|nr:hypothetical protein [Verrucomicrobiae bacterium]